MAQLSHEFRAPLATITKYFNDAAAKESALTPPTQNGRGDKLLGEVNRLNDLVNQLLQFSQKHKLMPGRTDVNLLIEQALFLHDAAIREHRIQVNYEPGKLPAIVADKSLLQSVFVNLIGNAIEAMEREGRLQIQTHLVNGQQSTLSESAATNNGKSSTNGAPATKKPAPAGVAKSSLSRLTSWLFVNPKESCNGAAERAPLTAEPFSLSVNGWPQKTSIQTFSPEKNVVTITIADNGTGIPEDKMDQLFLPFFTTKRNGTGLGLALSHKIILEHYGSIQVQSKVGQGTIFTIILPL
jgi:signal transduction histidine kinase